MAAVSSLEPSSTTRTSASQPRSSMQESTRSRAFSMRELSLYAGITILKCGCGMPDYRPLLPSFSVFRGCVWEGAVDHDSSVIGRIPRLFCHIFYVPVKVPTFSGTDRGAKGASRRGECLLNSKTCRKTTEHPRHHHRLHPRLLRCLMGRFRLMDRLMGLLPVTTG